jgi:hypothetical protein
MFSLFYLLPLPQPAQVSLSPGSPLLLLSLLECSHNTVSLPSMILQVPASVSVSKAGFQAPKMKATFILLIFVFHAPGTVPNTE